MMDDAIARAPYVADAFMAVMVEQAYQLVDDRVSITETTIGNALAKQCGMVVETSPAGTWHYQLTE
jgi:hypothetical protein